MNPHGDRGAICSFALKRENVLLCPIINNLALALKRRGKSSIILSPDKEILSDSDCVRLIPSGSKIHFFQKIGDVILIRIKQYTFLI